VLGPQPDAFAILEAILWSPAEGFYLLDRHLDRLRRSAGYFQVPLDSDVIVRGLEGVAARLPPEAHKVRIAMAPDGTPEISSEPLSSIARPPVQRVRLSRAPVDSSDVFLFHKTTNRRVFDAARAQHPGCDDVILWNANGEITESCTANVVVDIDGALVTPPVGCGLLAGVFRGLLIEQGEIVERIVSVADLRAAARIFLVNSVRRWMDCVLE
jgi:para-aminobenzoate synthetase / 4-amino-4-deoxychorismate lyase